MMDRVDPLNCALFLIVAFTLAGFVQAFWLRSPLAAAFQAPIDGGRTLRGKRLLGDNKTWAGFVAMIPAVGLAFAVLSLQRSLLPPAWGGGLWSLSTLEYGLLGCWAGLAFMAAELPNSLIKRQLGVAPGTAPRQRWARPISFLIDRLDSITGACLALALVVPLSWKTWICIVLIGPAIHALFSVFLYQLGVKARPL